MRWGFLFFIIGASAAISGAILFVFDETLIEQIVDFGVSMLGMLLMPISLVMMRLEIMSEKLEAMEKKE